MADTLHLQIITPDKLLVREDVDTVQIPERTAISAFCRGSAAHHELMIGEISYTRVNHAVPCRSLGLC